MPGRRRRGPSASRGVAMVTGRANQWRRYSLAVSCTRHPGVGGGVRFIDVTLVGRKEQVAAK